MTLLLASVYAKLLSPLNLLAILGGAVLGFFIVGIITQMGVRATGGKVIPHFVQWAIRILGAIAFGWLVAFFILQGGGGGWGGSGGGKYGENTEGDPDKQRPVTKDVKPPEKDTTPTKDGTPASGSLSVEVLMNSEIRAAFNDDKAAGEKAIQDHRFYRIRGTREQALLTIGEIRKELGRNDPPYKRLYVVLGKDRSDEDVLRVQWLYDLAKALKIPSERTAP